MIKLENITIELMVDDMKKSIDFYKELLGFNIIVSEPKKNPFFVILQNGTVELMLYMRKQFSEEVPKLKNMNMGGSIALYIGVKNIKYFYKEIKDEVVIIQALHETDYGSIEFSCEDCNGYILMFNERN